MTIERRTPESSVAEVIDHATVRAIQELVAALEVAIVEDRGGELSGGNRRRVLRGAKLAVAGLIQARALAEAAGIVLRGQPATTLHTTSALEVIAEFNEGNY